MPGSKPGSRRPPNAGKGRPKGSKNKASADVRAAAQVYTDEALATQVELMRGNPGAPSPEFLQAFGKLTGAGRWQEAAELAIGEVERLVGALKATPPQTRACRLGCLGPRARAAITGRDRRGRDGAGVLHPDRRDSPERMTVHFTSRPGLNRIESAATWA
jgi:hypothetical protein